MGGKPLVMILCPILPNRQCVLFGALSSVPPSLSPFSICIFKVSFEILEESNSFLLSYVRLQLLYKVGLLRDKDPFNHMQTSFRC